MYKRQYLFSFAVGFAFGKMLDVHELWVNTLPLGPGWQVLYFVLSYLILSFGIAVSNRCGLPIIPTDLFPRELSEIISAKYSRIKISFDVICVAVTAAMTVLFLGTSERPGDRDDSGSFYHGEDDRFYGRSDGSKDSVRLLPESWKAAGGRKIAGTDREDGEK